jgi:subtilisin family serine protease
MRAETGQDDHGHGSHVASTIAGNRVKNVSYPTVFANMEQNRKHKYYNSDIKVPVSGVAPHANIVAYKTCSVQGCAPSAAVAAIEHAIVNNIDVINYSVGGSAGSPWFDADALAFLAAREAGIYVAVAAGNSGRSGEKTIGSPGNSPWVTSVAALSHSRDFTEEKTASFSGGATTLEDLIGQGATSGILTPTNVVYAGDIEDAIEAELAGMIGVCGDYSLPSYWDVNSIEGKVVICRRGGVDSDSQPLTRLSKGDVALKAKAAGMIFINATDEIDNIVNDLHVLPTVHLNKADGDNLLAWLAQGEGHQVSFTGSELKPNDGKADITANFTSRGPDYFSNDYLVPDVGAPGVEILAAGLGNNMQSPQLEAYERINGDFRFMSGTSMASPHIAGMYLLMKAANSQ